MVAGAENRVSYKQEVLRKLIHLSWIIIPIGYAFLNKEAMVIIIYPLTILLLIMEVFRHKHPLIKNLAHKLFGGMLRDHEISGDKLSLSGASYVLLASCILVGFFPKIIAICAISVLAISDAAASLIGRKFGRTKFFNKSLEGTLAFILSGLITVYVIGFLAHEDMLFFIAALVGVCISAIVEAASKKLKVDDNFSIPLSFGIFMWLLLQ